MGKAEATLRERIQGTLTPGRLTEALDALLAEHRAALSSARDAALEEVRQEAIARWKRIGATISTHHKHERDDLAMEAGAASGALYDFARHDCPTHDLPAPTCPTYGCEQPPGHDGECDPLG